MRGDSVEARLDPTRLGIGQAPSAQHRHEDMHVAELACQPIDDDRDLVAGTIDEDLVAGGMALAHRHRQLHSQATIEIAEAAVTVAVPMMRDVLVPDDLERHVLALDHPVDHGPVGLGTAAITRRAQRMVRRRFQRRVAEILAQRPGQPRRSSTP